MKSEITKVLGDGAVTLAVSSGVANKLGWFDFINANAPALGFMSSIFFGLVGTFFYYITYRSKNTNSIKIQEQEKVIKALQEKVENINERKSNN